MKYKIFEIGKEDVCIPDTSYYSKPGDWYSEEKTLLRFIKEFDTRDECIDFLKEEEYSGEFTILPTFKL